MHEHKKWGHNFLAPEYMVPSIGSGRGIGRVKSYPRLVWSRFKICLLYHVAYVWVQKMEAFAPGP